MYEVSKRGRGLFHEPLPSPQLSGGFQWKSSGIHNREARVRMYGGAYFKGLLTLDLGKASSGKERYAQLRNEVVFWYGGSTLVKGVPSQLEADAEDLNLG